MSSNLSLFTPCKVQTLSGHHLSPLSWGLCLGGSGLFGPDTAEVCVPCSSHFLGWVVPSVPGGGLGPRAVFVSDSKLLAWEKKLQEKKSLTGIFYLFERKRESTLRVSVAFTRSHSTAHPRNWLGLLPAVLPGAAEVTAVKLLWHTYFIITADEAKLRPASERQMGQIIKIAAWSTNSDKASLPVYKRKYFLCATGCIFPYVDLFVLRH